MSQLYVGIMSGTSLDGVDAVLADFSAAVPKLLGSHYQPYSDALREELLVLHQRGDDELHRAALLANRLSGEYADAVLTLLASHGNPPVTALGCHGQTIRHQPQDGYTTQLVNGALLAERTGVTAVVDFRSRDIAAGGQGAPLVPAFHAMVFRNPHRARAIVNIGGIANITCLPEDGAMTGFDTGPGNLLMDAWIGRHRGERYDAGGSFASTGKPDAELLARMLQEAFFRLPPPKSTGRDLFNLSWLDSLIDRRIAPEDVQATLAELTVESIAMAVRAHCAGAKEIYVCGGGAHNKHLLQRLTAALPGRQVATTAAIGLDPDWIEALAFAWLARQALQHLPGNAPDVTGAKGPRVLGAIYPA